MQIIDSCGQGSETFCQKLYYPVDKSIVVAFPSQYNRVMKNSFLKIIFALVFFLLPLWPSVVSASTTDNISGWAWSSNIGWISFNNCTNPSVPSTCTGTSYGVNKDGSGNLVGYAWSENIGWIQFGNLDITTMPNGSGNTKTNAKVDVSNKLTGWAKALSANGNGWDGWISLSGTSPNYGVTLTNTGSTSYDCAVDCVWGSDVVGWVDWSGVVATATSVPVVTISANPTSGTVGVVNPTITWSATNSPTSCTASDDWSGSKAIGGGSQSQGVLTQVRTYTYTLTCTNAGGSASASATVVVNPVPTCPNGATNPPTCTTCPAGYEMVSGVCTPIPTSTDGLCSIPPALPVHYNCAYPPGDTGTNRKSNAANWTWDCVGSTSTASCSQPKKPPVIRED